MENACHLSRRPSPRFVSWLSVAALLAGLAWQVSTTRAEEQPAGSFTIPAWAFDRGNAKTFADPQQYADAGPMVANGGSLPWVVEYDVDFPVAATYALHFRYAAATARPMDLFLDGKNIGKCCKSATGGWNTSTAKWEESSRLSISKGKHTLKLTCQGAPPHVASLRLDSPTAFPKGSTSSRPACWTTGG